MKRLCGTAASLNLGADSLRPVAERLLELLLPGGVAPDDEQLLALVQDYGGTVFPRSAGAAM